MHTRVDFPGFALKLGLTALFAGAVSVVHAGPVFGVNLITNPGAEAGPGSTDGFVVVPTPSWTTTGSFNVVPYGLPGGFPLLTDVGSPTRGLNFFAGGPNTAFSDARQLIDLSGGAGTIDGGQSTFLLEGWLGGFTSQADFAVLTAQFLDANMVLLGSASIGPVSNAQRGNVTSFLYRSSTGFVPAGARSVEMVLAMTRQAGAYDDGYADDLALTLTAGPDTTVPEPSAFALGLTGLALIVVRFACRVASR